MTELIILDLYGTLVKSDVEDNEARPGFQEFWEYYKRDHLFVVSTDDLELYARVTLEDSNILDNFDEVYGAGYLDFLGGHYLKNLGSICQNAGVHPKDAVFIGDNCAKKDERSASYAKIRFIKVLQFRQDTPSRSSRILNGPGVVYENLRSGNLFTFKSLIGKI